MIGLHILAGFVFVFLVWQFFKQEEALDEQTTRLLEMRAERNKWKYLYENFTGDLDE